MTGMSIRQAARFSGNRVSAESIEAIEGGRAPTADELAALAETYEVNLEWLSDGPERIMINARSLDGLVPNDVEKLMRQLQAHRQV